MSVRSDDYSYSVSTTGRDAFAPQNAHPEGFSGAVPAQNPWQAAYPAQRKPGRFGSHVVYGRANRFSWEGSGNLSVKTVFTGHANIELDDGRHRVEPSSYLVINHGRPYRFALEGREPVEGLSLYFDRTMTLAAIRAQRANVERELADPRPAHEPNREFFERIFIDGELVEHLGRIRENLPRFHADSLWVQETLHTGLDLLLDRHRDAVGEMQTVGAVRTATKEELYRRLYKARDYAYATLDQPVSLDDLAYVACLSTNYFLRSFRALFRQTPHQYIIEKRIERAGRLLTKTQDSVGDICLSVGFQSLGSFSWLFKKRTGLSPEAFRRANATAIR